MKNHNILISGGSGYVGSNLAKFFAKEGYTVHLIGRAPSLENIKKNDSFEFRSIFSDLGQDPISESIELSIQRPIIINCAGKSSGSFDELWYSNVITTKNMLKLAKHSQPTLFIHFSSGGVYGNTLHTACTENMKPDPFNNYSHTKCISEQLVKIFSAETGIPSIVFRLYFPYGGSRPNGIFSTIPNALQNNLPLKINLEGGPLISSIHVEDIALAINALVETENLDLGNFKIFNMCGNDVVSFLEIVQGFSKHFSKKPRYEYTHERVGNYIGSNAALKKYVDWSPRYKLIDYLSQL